MAELTTIARPYAEAAFRLAREGNALPVWSQMLRLLASVIADPKVAGALDNPRLTAGDKEALLLSICGDRLDPQGRSFVRVLVEADRVGVVPQIAALFEALKDDADGLARAQHRQRLPAVRRRARRTQGRAGAAFRQEDRDVRQRRPGADRRRQDHRRRHGGGRHDRGAALRDGDPFASLIETTVTPAESSAGAPRGHHAVESF